LRILHLSDVHGETALLSYALKELARKEKADLVVFSGDLEAYSEEPLRGCEKLLLAVTGNMDDAMVAALFSRLGVSVEGKCTVIAGIRVCGVGGRAPVRDAVKVLALAKGGGVDVLVTHYPPRGTKVDVALSGVHIGKEIVRDLIRELRPKLCLCGHVHEARGIDKLGETVLVNPGPLSWGLYAVIDVERMSVELKRVRGV